MYMFRPDTTMSSADYNSHPWYWNTFFSLISSGENSVFAHSGAAVANQHNVSFLFHQVPITAGWAEAVWNEKFA